MKGENNWRPGGSRKVAGQYLLKQFKLGNDLAAELQVIGSSVSATRSGWRDLGQNLGCSKQQHQEDGQGRSPSNFHEAALKYAALKCLTAGCLNKAPQPRPLLSTASQTAHSGRPNHVCIAAARRRAAEATRGSRWLGSAFWLIC